MRGTLLGAVLALAVSLIFVFAVSAFSGGGPARCVLRLGALTGRVDVSSSGAQADGRVYGGAISANGRYVAFGSDADNLVTGDDNHVSDVFVRDLLTGQTTRVSVSSGGVEANGTSFRPSISADGRYVAFRSSATNLVPGDRNGFEDIFVHDRVTGRTVRASVGSGGAEANGPSVASGISANGRYVSFTSQASNLVPGDSNGVDDVFVRDLVAHRTFRVSVGGSGEADGRSEGSSISANGHVVAFRSFATDLVPGDTNGLADDFVRNWVTGKTERVNVSSAGHEANGVTFRVFLSGSGRFVAFRSRASNLIPDDTNGVLDVFERDLLTGVTARISIASDGGQAVSRYLSQAADRILFMSHPVLSFEGRYAAFGSRASNLVDRDTNREPDVFVHDLGTGHTYRVSVSSGGGQANRGSYVAGISGDGRIVLFFSSATNLVCGDTNGTRDLFIRRWHTTGPS